MKITLPVNRRRARIEIIPLIDIVFFLLATFVMVSLSMVSNQGISVNLPKASTGQLEDQSKSVTLTVNDQGNIFVDKSMSTFEEMSHHLAQLKAMHPDIKVFINGDDKAFFGQAVAVLDEVRRLGITKVSIRTKTNDQVRVVQP